MNILVIGSGGREHALAWKLQQSPQAGKLYALPGNPGMAEIAECVPDIAASDHGAVVAFAKEKGVGLVVVGPEAPLADGLVDALADAGIKAFGPSRLAAEIEGSKAFSKDLMKKYDIPTAKYGVFSDAASARAYVRAEGAPIVVKADGLAAGKGVIVAMTEEEALAAIDEIMEDKAFGQAGSRVVIEEFMAGEEVSILAFTDGRTIRAMVPSQDHKRAYDGDEGPNTGGMGAYAPAPVAPPALVEEVQRTILEPTIRAMEKEGRLYKGCLYAGLMVTPAGVKVVEFNCRFGDPETEVVLPLLRGDLVEIMLACVDGTLDRVEIPWSKGAAVTVVLAAGGYPKAYAKGAPIEGLDEAAKEGCLVFHAGTAEKDGAVVSAGGRVLNVVAEAPDIRSAIEKAYRGVGCIHFKDAFCRRDIGHRALERMK